MGNKPNYYKIKNFPENTPEERSQYLDSIEDKLNKYIYEHKKGKKMLIDLVGQWMVNKKTKGKYIGLYGPLVQVKQNLPKV